MVDYYSKTKTKFKEQNSFFNLYNFEELNHFIKELFELKLIIFRKNFCEPYLISNEKYINYFIWNSFL